jgi:LmbE family N-acetylglucosaminyl deacetylase
MTIGVVAAHPDDEVLGCGGTIARLARDRHVSVIILGEGISARCDRREEADAPALQRLVSDARTAAALLGVGAIEFAGLPDNRFDQLPLLDVIKRVERWVEQVQPSVIYTHHPGDLNVDHVVTFRAVLTATRPARGCPVRELYGCEVPSSTEWAFHRFEPVFRPNVFVDVSDTIETKVRAMQSYGSEIRPFPHPRSPEALRAVARRWGSVVGVDYAEPFELVRAVR